MTKSLVQKSFARFSRLPLKWYLLLIILLAVSLRALTLTKAGIWHDEGYSATIISFSPSEIIGHTMRDFHPPLYVLTLRWWSLLFGSSEFALRGMSLLFGVATVLLVYFIVKRLRFGENTARLATLFAAVAPFLIRYSQEARMYGMAAFLACAATLSLLIALDWTQKPFAKQLKWWLIYGLLMAAAIYTHYYTAFIVFVHIGYSWYRLGGFKKLITNKAWWAGNLLAASLFSLWIPTAIAQFSRVQQGYWIAPVNGETIPNTIMQFLAFASNELNSALEFLIATALACIVTALMIKTSKNKRAQVWFVVAWLLVPLLITLLISIVRQPVYYDRYFIYSAVAFSVLLAILVTHNRWRPTVKLALTAGVVALALFGVNNVSKSANHQMQVVASVVNNNIQADDLIISGELYTYFDFSYYNKTGKTVHLLSKDDLIPTGESSLIYAKRAEIVFHSLHDINQTAAKRVWLIGKTGQHDYNNQLVPDNWQLISQIEAGDSAARLFVINR